MYFCKKDLLMSKTIIYRKKYLSKTKPFIDNELIKVFLGQRRVGKSFVMKMIADYVLKNNQKANIIFIDKELYDYDFIKDYHSLIKYVEEKVSSTQKNYLFIDEIQEIELFEKALRHIQNKKLADIYCTGSNAKILSSELATFLSGRFIEIPIFSLSYVEFLEFNQFKESNQSLQKYLKWGSLPFIKNLQQEDAIIFDYLKNISATIIYKDIINRYSIRNIDFFDNLILFIAANTGNLITAKKISDYLKSQKINISAKVVINYLTYLQNAFLIYKTNRVEINSKKVFSINHKYFFEDWGLRNALLGLHHYSLPDVLENVVFAHLQKLGYSVSVGVLKDLEIDFIAKKNGRKIYIQVAYLITSKKVKEREFGNLLLINDNYPKYVISLDQYTIGDFKGVKHIHLHKFLLNDDF